MIPNKFFLPLRYVFYWHFNLLFISILIRSNCSNNFSKVSTLFDIVFLHSYISEYRFISFFAWKFEYPRLVISYFLIMIIIIKLFYENRNWFDISQHIPFKRIHENRIVIFSDTFSQHTYWGYLIIFAIIVERNLEREYCMME